MRPLGTSAQDQNLCANHVMNVANYASQDLTLVQFNMLIIILWVDLLSLGGWKYKFIVIKQQWWFVNVFLFHCFSIIE
jgi:hypothetical protein